MVDCAIINSLTYRGILAMLDQTFGQVYTKFKLHFYKQIFSRFEDREATLTTVESSCMQVIMALVEPTIAQFSHMMNLSTPNAAYKINSLVKKAMWSASNPPPISGNTACGRPKSTLITITSAILTCIWLWSVPNSGSAPMTWPSWKKCCRSYPMN